VKAATLKAIIAACVLGAAVVAVWAFARLRDTGGEPAPVAVSREERRPTQPASRAPGPRTSRGKPLRGGKPLGPPQATVPPTPLPTTPGQPPRPAAAANPPPRPEEVAVRKILEPLIARRPNAELPFVRCLDPGGWKQGASTNQQGESGGESDDPLDVPPRDPGQAVCRARVRTRDRAVLFDVLKDASTAYRGHLAATDPREHLDAYLGRWYEADLQVDTEEAYPVIDP
jgi:hypothetical protein